MILEIAEFYIRPNTQPAFESALRESLDKYISKSHGFINAQLHQSIEDDTRFILLVNWETLEDHTVGFRQSEQFKYHRELITPYFAKDPFVQH
ncbi:MAG TPA: antibiotic biosynthesis monooxygenase, partial [Aggregatilineales bacterium]|nr:antibiotic biosynthesis monooxygenase [Aggregatilineales bacterium]